MIGEVGYDEVEEGEGGLRGDESQYDVVFYHAEATVR